MFERSTPRQMAKRATLEIDDQVLRRVPVFELPDGTREVPVPMDRLRSTDTPEQLPEFASVTHSGYEYDAELVMDGEDPFYDFEVENY